MRHIRAALARLAGVFTKHRSDDDLRDELQSHLDMETAENIRRDGDRLVYLRQSTDAPGGENVLFSVPEVRDFRNGASALGGIAEYSPWSLTLQGNQNAVHIDVGLVTGNFFDVLGLSPVLGRLTQASDDGAGVPPVMVLTHEFWMKRFGGDSSIVGKQLPLDGTSVTVIGVVQPAPYFPDRMDALCNMVISPHHVRALAIVG